MDDLLARAPLSVDDGIPVFMTPDPYTENYRAIARDHLEAGESPEENPFIEDQVWRLMEESTAAMLRPLVQPGARLLDVGVGTGRLLELFPDLERSGIDISVDYLKLAQAKGIAPFLAKAEDMPFHDAMFDAVACTDVLEHVIDLNATLREIHRVLKPGGHLVLRVPYREDLSPYLHDNYPYEFAHLRAFDEHGLRLLLTRIAGFEALSESYMHMVSQARLRLKTPVGGGITTLLAGKLAAAVPAGYGVIARSLFTPLVINMAARKPQ